MSVSDETYTRLNTERPIHTPGTFKTLKRLKSKKHMLGTEPPPPSNTNNKSPDVVITNTSAATKV